MHTKCGLWLVFVLLAGGAAVSQTRPDAGFRSKAIVAILPGNPFESRLYSLERNVLTRAFFSKLSREYSITAPATTGPFIKYLPESSFEVTFEDNDVQKAVAVVKATLEAMIHEMESRRATDPTYGSARIQSPARPVMLEGRRRAEGVVAMDGPRWGQAEKREADAQAAALIVALSDVETLRAVARQGAFKTEDADSVARRVRSSISFHRLNDSKIEITLAAPDPTFLERLLDFVPKGKAEMAGRVPLADLDFVPKHMRNEWYVFNCCQVSPL